MSRKPWGSSRRLDGIVTPPFKAEELERGHAVHFRCQAPEAAGLRIDVMAKLRDLPSFEELWDRRTTIGDGTGWEIPLLSLADLVQAKKTQRSKDWPMIEVPVEEHFIRNRSRPTPASPTGNYAYSITLIA